MEKLKKFGFVVGFGLLCIVSLATTIILVMWPYLIYLRYGGKTPCVIASIVTGVILIIFSIVAILEFIEDSEELFIPVAYCQAVFTTWVVSGGLFLVYSVAVDLLYCL